VGPGLLLGEALGGWKKRNQTVGASGRRVAGDLRWTFSASRDGEGRSLEKGFEQAPRRGGLATFRAVAVQTEGTSQHLRAEARSVRCPDTLSCRQALGGADLAARARVERR